MKVMVLARVSTEEQDSNAQLVRLKKYCEEKGFTNPQIYQFDESAYSDDRKQFRQIIEEIKECKDKVILCCDKIDRLTRKYNKDMIELENLVESGKLEIHIPSDGIIVDQHTPASDNMRFGFGVLAARYYSDCIRDNVKRRIEEKMSKGEVLTKAPFGYRNIRIDDRHGSVVLEPFEAEIVKQMYNWYESRSFSINEIRIKLKNEFGIDKARSQVARILNNKFYHGVVMYRRRRVEYEHKYPTLITKETYDNCKAIMSGRAQTDGRRKLLGGNAIYRGLFRCENCGRSITPEMHRSKYYYACTDYDKVCKKKYLAEHKITEQLEEVFKSIKVPQEALDKIVVMLKEKHSHSTETSKLAVKNLQEEYSRIENKKMRMYDDYLERSITREMYDAKLKEFTDRQSEINGHMQRLNRSEEEYLITMGYLFQLAANAHELFKCSGMHEKRQLINMVIPNATVNGEKLVYTMVYPFSLFRKQGSCLQWGG